MSAVNALLSSAEPQEKQQDKVVHQPVIDLFDGTKEVVKAVQKEERKIDPKDDPKPNGNGQQLTLF